MNPRTQSDALETLSSSANSTSYKFIDSRYTSFSPTRPSGPSWSSSPDVRVCVCLSVCPLPMKFFCVVGLVQSVPRPWTGAISITSRALKTRMCSGV